MSLVNRFAVLNALAVASLPLMDCCHLSSDAKAPSEVTVEGEKDRQGPAKSLSQLREDISPTIITTHGHVLYPKDMPTSVLVERFLRNLKNIPITPYV